MQKIFEKYDEEIPLEGYESGHSFAEDRINRELLLNKEEAIRQYEIGPYKADFFFKDKNLVLEIDGKDFHSSEEQESHDRRRDRYMTDLGYCVVRVSGKVAWRNPSGVLSAIRYIKGVKSTLFIREEEDLKFFIKSQIVFDENQY